MTNRSYRTASGTELPLLNLKGKEYLEVKYRLVWFREDHPDWSIETELMAVTDVSAYARATVRDEKTRVIATSHKFESVKGFPDFIEKAETGAIGRALALIGYGTQFCADELDEGARIVDAPAQPVRSNQAARVQSARAELRPIPRALSTSSAAVALADTADLPEAPVAVAKETGGRYKINFGRKYKGRILSEIPKAEMESYIQWLEESGVRAGTNLAQQLEMLKNAFERFYGDAAH